MIQAPVLDPSARRSAVVLSALLVCALLLPAAPAAAQCNPSYEYCDSTPTVGPDVGISPDSGEYSADVSAQVPVRVVFTDVDGLDSTTAQIRLWSGGSYVTYAFPWKASSDGTRAILEGTIELRTAGENVLTAQAADRFGNVGSGSATFKLTLNDPELPIVSYDPYHNEFRNTAMSGLVLSYPAWSYTSMGEERTAGLLHNSELARPTMFFQVDAQPDPRTASQITALSLRIERWNNGASGTQTLLLPEIFYKAAGGKQRLAIYANWSVDTFKSGAYPSWAVVRAYKADGTYKERRSAVRFLILNERYSRYGAGWIPAGVKRLYVSNYGDGVMISEGDGILRFFKGNCAGATSDCSYTTPAGDFSQLTYRPASSTWLRKHPDGAEEVYSSAGLGTSSSDRFGNTTVVEWQYTQDGTNTPVVSRIVDPVGHATTFAYDAAWYLQSITTAGRTLTVAHNSGKALTNIYGPPNLQMTHTDSDRKVASFTWSYGPGDPGVTTDVTYNPHGKLRSMTTAAILANGQWVRPQTTYRSVDDSVVPEQWWTVADTLAEAAPAVLPENAVAQITDAGGHTATMTLDRYGKPTKIRDPVGLTTTLTWTADGLPDSLATDLEFTAYTWNSQGQLLLKTIQGAPVFEASYNQLNLPEFEASGSQGRWFAYGPRGELVRSWFGKKEDETRTATKYEYNARYQRVRATRPKGERVEWSYEGNVWRNADYQRIVREDGSVATTSYEYDQWSRLKRVTDPYNASTTTEYDTLNRPTRVVNANGQAAVYTYTGPHMTRFTDPGGRAFDFTYNALGWLESEQFPGDPKPRRVTYDVDGLVIASTDRSDRTVTRTYDAGHRLLDRVADNLTTTFRYPDVYTTTVSNNESVVVTKRLAGVGVPASVSTAFGGYRFEIERVHDMHNAWRDVGYNLKHYAWDWLRRTDTVRYETNFRPSDSSLGATHSITDVSGRVTTMAYDTSGRPVRVTFPVGVTQHNWFRGDGLLTSTSFSTSTVNGALGASFSYDLLNRLSSRTSAADDRMWSWGYDALGQVNEYGVHTKATDPFCDSSVEHCTQYWSPVKVEQYGYDGSGNRSDRGAVVPPGTNRYSAFNGFSLEYDADGNIKRKSKSGFEQTFKWNALGQLTEVTTNGATVSYGYDGYGRRVRRTENGYTRYFIYDGDDLILETDGAGLPTRTYTHWPGIDKPNSVRITFDGFIFDYYYTMEHPGHVAGVLNTLGKVADKHQYTPFGEVESSSDSSGQPLRFTGRELDFTTGTYYLRNRWYDPTLARFVSQDPIGLAGGTNPYAYAGNDPVNRRDPKGLAMECPSCLPEVVVCVHRYTGLGCNNWWEDGPWGKWVADYEAWLQEEELYGAIRPGLVRPDPAGMGAIPSMPPPPPPGPTIGPYPYSPMMEAIHEGIRRDNCRFFQSWARLWMPLHTFGRAGSLLPRGRIDPVNGTSQFDRGWQTSLAPNYAANAQAMAAAACAGL